MKILQIAPPWLDIPPEGYGGTEWVIANLIKGLTKLNHEVTLFATKTSRTGGKSLYIFKKPLLEQGLNWNAALPPLVHFHEAFKIAQEFDFVHAHLSSQTDLAILPFLADLSDKAIPNLVTIHSRWPFDPYSHMDKLFLKLYAGKILAVNISKSMQKNLPKKFRDGGFVYNSLDISRMRFHLKKGKYLTWLGRIIPQKGLADAIKIAKMAGEQFIFAGIMNDPARSKKYFHEKVKPLIDGDQIKYLGPADLRMKNKLLGGAKGFLNPINWEEPFGMVIIEAMACGTPVISFNRGAAKEIIKNNKTGFIVKDETQMLKAISKLGRINRRNCRKHVEEHFSLEAAALKYLKLYQKETERYASADVKNGNGKMHPSKPQIPLWSPSQH